MKRWYRPTELEELPRTPGVYYMYDRTGSVIYVGKATSLKSRVNSYWQRPQNQNISRFLAEVDQIRIKDTASALEALILEANEIKRLQPRYNVLQKDDKRFASIVITREPFPQLLVVRPTDKRTLPLAKSFGPYQSAFTARIALKILRRIFPYRCTKPAIDPPILHPEGVTLLHPPGVSQGRRPCLYYPMGLCPGTCVSAIDQATYRATMQRIQEFLSGRRTSVILSLKQSMAIAAKQRNYEAAAKLRDQLFALDHIHDVALLTDDRESTIAQFPIQRIECYDISLAAGRDAVGSMVVLRYGVPTSSEYRRFKIKTVEGTNDVAMLTEVLSRRMNHPEWPLPELFSVDGGIPQRNAAVRALRAAGVPRPAVIGVTKGPERKRADLIPNTAAHELIRHYGLSMDELERVLRTARDEAHRFAITYHRKLRSQRFLNK